MDTDYFFKDVTHDYWGNQAGLFLQTISPMKLRKKTLKQNIFFNNKIAKTF